MASEPTLSEQAYEALERALAAGGSERHLLVEKALELHRQARANVVARDAQLSSDDDAER